MGGGVCVCVSRCVVGCVCVSVRVLSISSSNFITTSQIKIYFPSESTETDFSSIILSCMWLGTDMFASRKTSQRVKSLSSQIKRKAAGCMDADKVDKQCGAGVS